MSNAGKIGGEWNDPAHIGPTTVDFAKMPPRRVRIPETARMAQPCLSDEILALCNCGVVEYPLAYHAYNCAAMLAADEAAATQEP